MVLNEIPLPNDLELRKLALQSDLITPFTRGMTFGHGIVLKDGLYDRRLIAHELGHVLQYERFGGIEPFLKAYISEVLFPPYYPNGPLEKEAEQSGQCRLPKSSLTPQYGARDGVLATLGAADVQALTGLAGLVRAKTSRPAFDRARGPFEG
jgi:Domain of unknown function (DUF4157)